MRKFGTDKPEFLVFQLEGSEKIYKLPLSASMPAAQLLAMQEAYSKGTESAFKFQIEFLRKNIGKIADTLTAATVGEIFTAWSEESGKQGAEPGE